MMSKLIGEKHYKWRELSEDYFICEIRDFCLRVKQMDEDLWWWALSMNNTPLLSGTEETELKAKQSVIIEYQSYFGKSFSPMTNKRLNRWKSGWAKRFLIGFLAVIAIIIILNLM